MSDSLTEIIRNAEERFWAAIAEAMPEIGRGDLPADAAAEFSRACETAAIAWVAANGEG